MGNESSRSGVRLATSLTWLVACVAAVCLTSAPERASAHGDKTKPPQHEEPHAEAELAARHPYPPEGIPRPLAWLGKLHPLITHFPIALLTVAALAELLLLQRPGEPLHHAVRFCVWAGAAGAFAAAPLGWLFAGFRIVDADWVMTTHRWLGTATAIWAAVTLLICERTYQGGGDRRALRISLLGGALLVAATGFFGGSLIYGLDHYAW